MLNLAKVMRGDGDGDGGCGGVVMDTTALRSQVFVRAPPRHI